MTSRRKHWCEERRVLAWADDELRVRRRAVERSTNAPRLQERPRRCARSQARFISVPAADG